MAKAHLQWIDVPLARKRLAEIDREITSLQNERAAIAMALGGVSDISPRGSAITPKPRGRPKGDGNRESLVDLIVDALRLAPASGRTVKEIIHHIAAAHPERVAAKNSSAAVSSAIAQAMRSKKPRIKVLKRGGKGIGSTYAAG